LIAAGKHKRRLGLFEPGQLALDRHVRGDVA
jgi:hypothetical protein